MATNLKFKAIIPLDNHQLSYKQTVSCLNMLLFYMFSYPFTILVLPVL